MPQRTYLSTAGDANAATRATQLSCAGVRTDPAPPRWAPSVTTLPGVLIEGQGGSPIVYVAEPTTLAAVDSAAAPMVTAENTAATQAANAATIAADLAAALATNTTYLALANPTSAQNTAQIKELSRQLDKAIRLALGRFEATT